MKTAIPDAENIAGTAAESQLRRSSSSMELPSKWRNALQNHVPEGHHQDDSHPVRAHAVGAVLIPLLMIIFSLLGYSY